MRSEADGSAYARSFFQRDVMASLGAGNTRRFGAALNRASTSTDVRQSSRAYAYIGIDIGCLPLTQTYAYLGTMRDVCYTF